MCFTCLFVAVDVVVVVGATTSTIVVVAPAVNVVVVVVVVVAVVVKTAMHKNEIIQSCSFRIKIFIEFKCIRTY